MIELVLMGNRNRESKTNGTIHKQATMKLSIRKSIDALRPFSIVPAPHAADDQREVHPPGRERRRGERIW